MNPTTFYDLISGRRRGALAALARGALRIAETPYAAAMRWRNAQYDSGRRLSTRVAVPVVCVGNLTLGGTGKTPFVAWLARWLRSRGVRVTLISRGYGAEQGGRNDEARELEQRLPDVPHLQNPNRVEAARTAIEECECQMILLDDGFQHRRLARDLDIVLLDALEPFGFGHVFPRGTLREPLAGLRRAQVVALSRADAVDAGERARIRETALRHAPAALWIEVAQRPRSLLNAAGARQPLEFLHGQRCAAFCGIGNPAGFRHTLAAAGAEVFALREFSDHHDYTREEIEALGRWAAEAAVQQILCTHKDLVKIGVTRLGELPLWAVEIGLEFLHGEDEFAALVGALLARIPPEPAEE